MIVSYIQNLSKYIYLPIYQIPQVVPVNWKEKTMLLGMVISVCCAVITFFTQTTFICSAFAALSGVCGLGVISVRHYESVKKLQECIKTLQEENQAFTSHNQTLEAIVIEERKIATQLTVENEKLKTEVSKLTIHTEFLHKTSHELLTSVEELRINLIALGPIVTGSQEIEEKLGFLSRKMETQQAVSKHLIELISKTMTEQADQLTLKKEILQQLQSLQNNDTTFQKLKELNLLQEQLSSIYDKLGSALSEHHELQNKSIQTSNQLSYIQEQNSLENTRLQETRQELSRVSLELKNTHLALNALLEKYHSFLLKYEKLDKDNCAQTELSIDHKETVLL